MRIPKTWVPILARKIGDAILSREMVRPSVPIEKYYSKIEEIILDELTVEDRLNDEVRELLKKHSGDIERGKMDYRKLFDLTKQRLVKERNLVL